MCVRIRQVKVEVNGEMELNVKYLINIEVCMYICTYTGELVRPYPMAPKMYLQQEARP